MTAITKQRSLASVLTLLLLLCLLTTLSLATKVKTAAAPQQQEVEESRAAADEKCRWGEPCSTAAGVSGGGGGSSSSGISTGGSSSGGTPSANSSKQQPNQEPPAGPSKTNNLPFVKKSKKINTGQNTASKSSLTTARTATTTTTTTTSGGQQQHYIPPEGFHVDARVYTDPNDQLAHFDEEGSLLLLPYFDCASTGITTLPIKLQHGYFRHTISTQTQPSSFEGSEFFVQHDNAAAILLITLHQSSLTMELNSGEHQQFGPGSVILLEDVVAGGHKWTSSDGNDVTVLLLTLPPHYVKAAAKGESAPSSSSNHYCLSILRPTPKIRRSILMGLGAATSLLLADWLGKVAPIWLSVGIGGGCLVVGGTLGFVKSGESLLDRVEVHRERRRYSATTKRQATAQQQELNSEHDSAESNKKRR